MRELKEETGLDMTTAAVTSLLDIEQAKSTESPQLVGP